jgi:hypothetical protein
LDGMGQGSSDENSRVVADYQGGLWRGERDRYRSRSRSRSAGRSRCVRTGLEYTELIIIEQDRTGQQLVG